MMNVFVFDIETIPDVETGRRLMDLEGLDDHDVGNIMLQQRRQETGGSEFLRHHLHKVVAISVVLRSQDKVKVWSLGEKDASEKELVQRFFDGIDRFVPTIVSWNGSGFDLPVLHYRAMLHGITAARYWDTGEDDRDFKWNNYISRYHSRHTDLMDLIASYQPRAAAPLDQIASMLGFPGKMGMSGAKVWDNYQAGDIEGIRNYCETDVLNTYLVYLRFELMRGHVTPEQYEHECDLLKDSLGSENKEHLSEFLNVWQQGSHQ